MLRYLAAKLMLTVLLSQIRIPNKETIRAGNCISYKVQSSCFHVPWRCAGDNHSSRATTGLHHTSPSFTVLTSPTIYKPNATLILPQQSIRSLLHLVELKFPLFGRRRSLPSYSKRT